MVKKVCLRHSSRTNRHLASLNLARCLQWRDKHPRLFNWCLALFVLALVGLTLVWQQPSIAKKLASTSLDDYFKEDVLSSQKDDRDRDGLADAVEVELKTDPDKPDSDGDGLLDGEEVNTYKTNPLAVDTDGDKYSDATEVLTGHDPNRASSSSEIAGKKTETGSASAAESLDGLSQLLNGEAGSTEMSLADLNISNLSDVASAFGTGNAAKIEVTDSDLKIFEVPDNEAKAKVETYINEIGELMMNVFREEFNDPEGSKSLLQNVIAGGEFDKLDQSIKKAGTFSDGIVKIAVPAPAKEFHKLLLKVFLESQSLGENLQQVYGENLTSLLVLDQYTQLESDLSEFVQAFNQLSSRFELGYYWEELDVSSDTVSD